MSENQTPVGDGKLIVRRFWEEVVNQGRLELIDTLFAPNCEFHNPVISKGHGLHNIKTMVEMVRTAFPDVEVSINAQMAAEGVLVVTQWTGEGTHTGQGDDLPPPTYERVEVPGMSISRVVGDRIEEVWFVLEPLGELCDDEDIEGLGAMFCRHFPKLC